MSNDVRFAIAGFGLIGRRHADAIGQCPGARLSAVIEPGADGRKAAAEQGIACYDSLEAFFRDGGADGVILATPNNLHVEQALACLERNCPTLIEKPIATSVADARGLVDTAEARGIPILVGHHRRHNPLIQQAKAVIASGGIGEVRAVQATCWFYKPDEYFEIAEWRRKPGAGPIAVNLSHDIDLIRYLCGEVRTVQAATCSSARGYENEDVAGVLLQFANGAIGTVTVSDSIVAPWSWELTSRENPVYPPTPESCYLVGGSHGSLSVPDLRRWHHEDARRDWWTPISATSLTREATDPLVNQIGNFAAVIRSGAEPLVSGREGLRTLEVIEAIQRSAETGGRIELA